MRQSREVAAETRERIVKVAARQFRKYGIDGVGIADLMAKAGLTHGGFYKHFPSKDALAAEACRSALAAGREELASAVAAAPKGRGLQAIVDTYLTMLHRDHPGRGCAIAALAGETARVNGMTRDAVAEGHDRLVSLVADQLERHSDPEARRRALAIVSMMVGALIVARTITDRALAGQVLQSAREHILAMAK